MIHGVDVSVYQKGWKPAAGDSFVFVKATEGRTYTNPEYVRQTAAGRAAGMVIGSYHFLHPGNAKAQAAYYVAQAKPAAGDILVCDWENTSSGHPSVEDAAVFIAEVKRLKPQNKVLLYCNRSSWVGTKVKAPDGLWVAEYGVTKPNTTTDWIFHQYTDKPLDQNRCKFATKAELVAWSRSLIPKPAPVPVVKTVKDARVTLAASVPVKSWGDVDLIQAFDVYGGTLVALQAQPVGKREDARVRWHSIKRVAGRLVVTYVSTDTCVGAGHPQTVNLNAKVNLPWAGRKATFKRGKPKRNPIGSKDLPIASWPKTGTASRTATATTETYKFAYRLTRRSITVRKSGGTFQGCTANANHIFRINGKTIDSDTKHKVTVTQFDWKGRTVAVKDLTYLLKELGVSSLEPEGLSFCQMPGDTKPYLYAGFRTGSVARRQYLLHRIDF